MNADQINEARSLATPVTHDIAVDKSPAFLLQYCPSMDSSTRSAVTAKITSNGLKILFDSASIDGWGNATNWVTYASNTLMSDFLNSVNQGPIRILPLDVHPSDTANDLATFTATSIILAAGKTVYWNNDAHQKTGVAISGNKFISTSVNGKYTDEDDECENSFLYGKFNIQNDATLKVYSIRGFLAGGVSELGYTKALGSDSDVEVGESDPGDVFISARRGDRLVIRAEANTNGQDSTPTTFHVIGKTAVLKNNRIVEEIPYS